MTQDGMSSKTNAQYFSKYAETESNALIDFPGASYGEIICIPAYNESPDFLQSLFHSARTYQQLKLKKVLIVIIVNQPDSDKDTNKNQAFVETITNTAPVWKKQNLSLFEDNAYDLLVIDRYSDGQRIPAKKGVGKARKIAADIAARLVIQGKNTSAFIHCSDADVIFPDDYFMIEKNPEISAYIFPFTHKASQDETVSAATSLYELSLIHYVQSLANAGSPYAFQTIGSCLCINANAYIQARGFPQKPAGEDFYLLNKLRKMGAIENLTSPILEIQSRISKRVPFGTGPAVERLIETPEASAIFYHPECFTALKSWLDKIESIIKRGSDLDSPIFIDEKLLAVAEHLMLYENLEKIKSNTKTKEKFLQGFHEWFDAFKTLKFIHFYRDHYFGSITLKELGSLSEEYQEKDTKK